LILSLVELPFTILCALIESSRNRLFVQTQGELPMKLKALSFFVGIFLFVSSLAAPLPAKAWTVQPQKVAFLNAQGIMLTGWIFKPGGAGPFPAVVMMHGCAGVYSYSDPARGINSLYREWGDRLIADGYAALLVDSFTPRKALQNQCELARPVVSEVKVRHLDAYAGLKFLASKPYVDVSKVALLGWSQGGSSVMAAMHVGRAGPVYRFKAAAVFYPGCGLRNAFGGISQSTWRPYAPFMIFHGSADAVVRPAICRTRVTRAQILGATFTRIIIYRNAQHSFDTATALGGSFTQADVDAKLAADARIMQFFAGRLR
jgi:dienelactone hydrolase